MSARWFELTIAILATWRVSHLIAREDGPWDIVLRLRSLAGTTMAGRLMDCPYCLSLWLSLPVLFLVAEPWPWRLMLWLATSGGACLLERLWESYAGAIDAVSAEKEEQHV